MINLIPPAARSTMVREYWMRVISVWMLLVGVVLAVVVVLQVPSYILLTTQLEAFQAQLQDAQLVEADLKKQEQAIIDANQRALHLQEYISTDSLVWYVQTLEALANTNVSLTNFTLARNDGVLESITVSGVAATRISLAEFSADVVAHESFATADVPIETLASDRDLPFSIDVILVEPE